MAFFLSKLVIGVIVIIIVVGLFSMWSKPLTPKSKAVHTTPERPIAPKPEPNHKDEWSDF
jgi:hypothetical protein